MYKLPLTLLFISALTACNRNAVDLGKDITIPVNVESVKLSALEKYVDITGVVQPMKQVELRAEISGKYNLKINPHTGRAFALGDMVNTGTVIIELTDEEYENNIKLNSLKLNLDITKQVYDKQQSLYEKGGVTLSELKRAEISALYF